MHGTGTLAAEVTHVSTHGLWILLGDEELFLSYADFPWFRGATIERLSRLDWPTPDHLCWPSLDIDLSVQSIRDPASFPLQAK